MVRAPEEDWIAVLDGLEKGDRVAVARVTAVITGFLARYGAYDVRDSWDDVCQEVLISLIRSARRGALREPSAFISYTGTITRNLLLDWIRREKRDLPVQLEADDVPGDPDVRLDLQRAVEDLPQRLRAVVEAIYIQGHSYQAAAELIGMPFGTLKRLRSEAIGILREKMRFQNAEESFLGAELMESLNKIRTKGESS